MALFNSCVVINSYDVDRFNIDREHLEKLMKESEQKQIELWKKKAIATQKYLQDNPEVLKDLQEAYANLKKKPESIAQDALRDQHGYRDRGDWNKKFQLMNELSKKCEESRKPLFFRYIPRSIFFGEPDCKELDRLRGEDRKFVAESIRLGNIISASDEKTEVEKIEKKIRDEVRGVYGYNYEKLDIADMEAELKKLRIYE